jgi:D-alanyl-D-alanine carboxypeptidase
MSEDVVWRIGSITKTFTAVAVLQLAEQGTVDLDAPVATYLDSTLVPEGVTVRHLLQHTSGIPDYTPTLNDVARSCPPSVDPLSYVEGLPPDFPPGARWAYSNTNYLILGQLIEAVTGEPPAAIIRRRIIDPLGLADTYLEGSEPGPPPVPAFADFYDTGPGPITCDTPIWPDATEAGMVSSAADLDAFLRALFGGHLLSAATLEEMLATNDEGYGLGIQRLLGSPVEDVEFYGNGGGVVGYRSVALYEAGSGTTVVLMTPTGFVDIGELQARTIEWAFR